MIRSIKRKLEQDPDFSHHFHHHGFLSAPPTPTTTATQKIKNDHAKEEDCILPNRLITKSPLPLTRVVQTPPHDDVMAVVSHIPVSVGTCSSTTTSISSTNSDSSIASLQQNLNSLSNNTPGGMMENNNYVDENDESSTNLDLLDPCRPDKKQRCHYDSEGASSLSQQPRIGESTKVGTTTTTLSKPTTLLLARPKDSAVLSPLHVFIRNQIEVFTVTEKEISQPSPGRKKPIKLNQVGLRCIHCKHMQYSNKKDRVKRAVCYPTSVGRVYHSVSDMKFDHFNNCRALSQQLREEFEQLKKDQQTLGGSSNNNTRSIDKAGSSSTAQYYHDAACEMGLIDDGDAIYISSSPLPPVRNVVSKPQNQQQQQVNHAFHTNPVHFSSQQKPLINNDNKLSRDLYIPSFTQQQKQQHYNHMMQQLRLPSSILPTMHPLVSSLPQVPSHLSSSSSQQPKIHHQQLVSSMPSSKDTSCQTNKIEDTSNRVSSCSQSNSTTKVLTLAYCPELDQQHLNPLHCFVRRHIEVFAANDNDISAPAPGRKNRVILGQVGLRCVHCAKQLSTTKDDEDTNNKKKTGATKKQKSVKVKRAVCYPPSISAIYHSVSNMKFDHFGNCQGLPPNDKVEFERLRSSCDRRRSTSSLPCTNTTSSSSCSSTGKKSKSPTIANSTAQYYHDSAIRLGLIDTEQGIRFKESTAPVSTLSSSASTTSSSSTTTTVSLTFAQPPKSRRFSSSSASSTSCSSSCFSSSSERNTDGLSALVLAATDPNVRAAYEEIRRLKSLLAMHEQ